MVVVDAGADAAGGAAPQGVRAGADVDTLAPGFASLPRASDNSASRVCVCVSPVRSTCQPSELARERAH